MSVRVRLTHETAEGTAAGIYGLIVSAGVLTAGHAKTAPRLMAATLVTLAVYWAAERYARIVAERIHAGRRPAWPDLLRQLTTGWEIMSASALPLLTLLVFWLVGAALTASVLAALICATVLLALAGWRIGGAGQLRTGERLMSSAVAATFGIVMIVLKTALH